MSEEKRAVDEAIRLEVIEDALNDAFWEQCLWFEHCGDDHMPAFCFACGWNAAETRARLEQAYDESS